MFCLWTPADLVIGSWKESEEVLQASNGHRKLFHTSQTNETDKSRERNRKVDNKIVLLTLSYLQKSNCVENMISKTFVFSYLHPFILSPSQSKFIKHQRIILVGKKLKTLKMDFFILIRDKNIKRIRWDFQRLLPAWTSTTFYVFY